MIRTLIAVLLIASPLFASEPQGGGTLVTRDTPCLTHAQRQKIQEAIAKSRADLIARGLLTPRTSKTRPVLGPPVRETIYNESFHGWGISNFFDHQVSYPNQTLDYNGGTRTYDTESGYNHQGTDYATFPFAWTRMADDQAVIIATAPGTIVFKEGGRPDKSCSFDVNTGWNAVYIEHADGSIAWYGHMKKDSLIDKPIGATVEEGEVLGVIGSSGISTGPHLHLELYDSEGNLIDPYVGPFNPTTKESWWRDQEPYTTTRILDLQTHFEPPVFGCSDAETPNLADRYDIGQRVYLALYLRDQISATTAQLRLVQPDGGTYTNWDFGSINDFPLSYWWWNIDLNVAGLEGIWHFEVTYQDQTERRAFAVGNPGPPVFEAASTSSTTVSPGDSVTLQWQTDNATRVFIDGIGYADVDGEIVLTPEETTTYTLRATGPGGEESVTSVLVTVGQKVSSGKLIGHVTATGGGFDTLIILANPTDAIQPYTLASFDNDGNLLETVSDQLNAGETTTVDRDLIFTVAGVSHFTFSGDERLTATIAYRATAGGSPAHLHAGEIMAESWRIYPGDWSLTWDGIAVVNAGDIATSVLIRQISADGTEIDRYDEAPFESLVAGGKALANIVALGFNPVEGSYFLVEADQPLALVALRGSLDGTLLWVNVPLVEP